MTRLINAVIIAATIAFTITANAAVIKAARLITAIILFLAAIMTKFTAAIIYLIIAAITTIIIERN